MDEGCNRSEPMFAAERIETQQEMWPSEIDCPHARLGRSLAPKKPLVISASKRTDIPAFYLPWLIERMRAGWVDVPNPMFRHARDPVKALTHVSLRPEHVRAVVWWSKNYGPYLKLRRHFDAYPLQTFQFTINPRRPEWEWIEPDVPPIVEALRQARELVEARRQPDLISWRFDPLCFWTEGGAAQSTWDSEFFERMCRALTELDIRRCFTSVADLYEKFRRRTAKSFPWIQLREPDHDELTSIAQLMTEIARSYGMQVFACTERRLEELGGFGHGSCIDGHALQRHAEPGVRVSVAKATDQGMPGRSSCGCTMHTDIGDYEGQECRYSCLYCYANPNHRRFAVVPDGR
jgi:hypothetical protein